VNFTGDRVSSIRHLLAAAARVYEGRHRLIGPIAETTGLSPEGVELGFGYLERRASDADLGALLAGASEAAHVHVILSANVFVAPLRALALAIAAAPKVTVRPSPRDPWLTRALVGELENRCVEIVDERSAAALDADSFHVYGRDETIALVKAEAHRGTAIWGHGAGLGVVILTQAAEVDAAAMRIALDVVAFDQRGCLSPRLVLVEGNLAQGTRVAEALHRELAALADLVPRGRLDPDEREQARRWTDTVAFAGRTWQGRDHVVGLGPDGEPLTVPPAGRHVHVANVRSLEDARALLHPTARFIVSVGTDDPERVRDSVPDHARLSPLGAMQSPPLDGPVDRRRA
jgi:hypothetical protein